MSRFYAMPSYMSAPPASGVPLPKMLLLRQNDPVEILPNLFQGSHRAAQESKLHQYGITHVINCSFLHIHYEYKDPNIKVLHFHWHDNETQSLLPDVHDAFHFIQEHLAAEHKVLVHCFAGISRSSAIVLYYIMRNNKCNFETALSALTTVNSRAKPNQGFESQLRAMCVDV